MSQLCERCLEQPPAVAAVLCAPDTSPGRKLWVCQACAATATELALDVEWFLERKGNGHD